MGVDNKLTLPYYISFSLQKEKMNTVYILALVIILISLIVTSILIITLTKDVKIQDNKITFNNPCLVDSELCTVQGKDSITGLPCYRQCRKSRWDIKIKGNTKSYTCVSNDEEGIDTCYHPKTGVIQPIGTVLNYTKLLKEEKRAITCPDNISKIEYREDCKDGFYQVPGLCMINGESVDHSLCNYATCPLPCFILPLDKGRLEVTNVTLMQTPRNDKLLSYGLDIGGNDRYKLYDVPLIYTDSGATPLLFYITDLGKVYLKYGGYWGFLKYKEDNMLYWTQAKAWIDGPGLTIEDAQTFNIVLEDNKITIPYVIKKYEDSLFVNNISFSSLPYKVL